MTDQHSASFLLLVLFPSHVLCSSSFSPSPSIIVSQTSPTSFRFPSLYQLAYSLLSSPHLDPSYLFLIHAIGFPFPLLQRTTTQHNLHRPTSLLLLIMNCQTPFWPLHVRSDPGQRPPAETHRTDHCSPSFPSPTRKRFFLEKGF